MVVLIACGREEQTSMKDIDIIEETSKYVFDLFQEKLSNKLVYHTYNHTCEVVESAQKLAKDLSIKKEEQEILLLAAWLHDTGYAHDTKEHEAKSCDIATEFLQSKNYPAEKLERIRQLIMATRMPQQPANLLEEILCDADLHNLGTKAYENKSALLRSEWDQVYGRQFNKIEWLEYELEFLQKHQFFTRAAHLRYNGEKEKNIAKLQKALLKARKKKKAEDAKLELKKKDIKRKEEKFKRPDRGVETMFRTASRSHINLSAIADNKANIMLSINAIIISVVISGLATKLDTNPILLYPTIILLGVCIVTIIFATLSTKPKIIKGEFTEEDIRNKQTNLLFFGNFYNMDLETYEWGMKEMMKDKEFLYMSLTRDLYFLGVVLAKKYKYLRIAYNIFMYGLIVSVLAYALTFLFMSQNPNPADLGLLPLDPIHAITFSALMG